MIRLLHLATVLLATPHAAWADDWISLGGMGFELDTASVEASGDQAYAWIRKIAAAPQGQLTTHMFVVAHCGQELLEIERGVLESDWSSKIVDMPELPPQGRFIELPVNNPAFNSLYGYLCG